MRVLIFKNKRLLLYFLVHSLRDRWMRTEACFYSDSLEGEFTGGDVLCDDRGYCGQGVAQGGIVDTPDGKWYAMLFQDSGAVGRIPILLPVTWKDHFRFWTERTCAGRNRGSQYQTRIYLSAISGK